MRVVEFESQRLTVYLPEGLLDRLALTRIPGVQRGHMPLLPFHDIRFRRWDEVPAQRVHSVWLRMWIGGPRDGHVVKVEAVLEGSEDG